MLEWNENYSVGIKMMDTQHRKIVDLINELFTMNEHRPQERQLKKVFEKLRDYIQNHFRDEEELMLKHGYPEYPEQKREHEAFIDRVCEFQKDFLKRKPSALINIFNFVWDWFAHHIVEMDKKYQTYFAARGLS
jgi:hemerythrin-like metal-binding protein